MADRIPPKLFISYIYKILKDYSDEEHRLSRGDIVKLLEKEYGLKIDAKRVTRNLEAMINSPYYEKICYETKEDKNGRELYYDWYLERDFDDSELRMIIDGLLFSKHIGSRQCKELIEKLKGLSNKYFSARVKHVCNMPSNMPENKQLLSTISVLDEAISRKKKVQFELWNFKTDKKRHFVKSYPPVSPYYMVATDGVFYLLCSFDGSDKVYHFRLDLIREIKITEQSAEQQAEKGRINLSSYIQEHPKMYSGDSDNIEFWVDKNKLHEVFDQFGLDVRFGEETDERVIVKVKSCKKGGVPWALQYGQYVEVTKPVDLRQDIAKAVAQMNEKYNY